MFDSRALINGIYSDFYLEYFIDGSQFIYFGIILYILYGIYYFQMIMYSCEIHNFFFYGLFL